MMFLGLPSSEWRARSGSCETPPVRSYRLCALSVGFIGVVQRDPRALRFSYATTSAIHRRRSLRASPRSFANATESGSQCDDEHRVRRRHVRTHSRIARSRCGYHISTSARRIRLCRGPSCRRRSRVELQSRGPRSCRPALECRFCGFAPEPSLASRVTARAIRPPEGI